MPEYAAGSELQVFSDQVTKISTADTIVKKFYPINPIAVTPITFLAPGMGRYLDASKTELDFWLKITLDNGNDIAAGLDPEAYIARDAVYQRELAEYNRLVGLVPNDGNHAAGVAAIPVPVAPAQASTVSTVNYIASTLIQQVKVYSSNVLISDSGDQYAELTYISTVLGADKNTKDTVLELSGYVEDNNLANPGRDRGWLKRHLMFQGSRTVHLRTKLLIPPFESDKLLPSDLELRFEIFRHNDNRVLWRFPADVMNYRLAIERCELRLHYVDLNPSFAIEFQKILAADLARYFIKRLQVRTLAIQNGTIELPRAHLYSGRMPTRVVVAFASLADAMGNYSNPFHYDLNQIRHIQLFANGVPYPELPLEVNIANEDVTDAYAQLQDSMVQSQTNTFTTITKEQFMAGYGFLAFDLTKDRCGTAPHAQLKSNGTIELKVLFQQQGVIGGGLRMFVFMEFENTVKIDSTRACIADYMMS